MNITHETVCEWMAQHGRMCYVTKINNLKSVINEIKGDAGRYWMHCEFTMKQIKVVEKEIEEVKESAYEKYIDWVTD